MSPVNPMVAGPVAPVVDERDRHGCIMQAALALIGEVGYERMTMDAIASRAKASKATIYRRWDSKAALVVDAVGCRVQGQVEEPNTGDLRTDLIQGLTATADQMSNQDKGLITGIFSAINTDPELGRLVREQVFAAKKEAGQTWATHAIARGEISAEADTELANELAISTLFHRVVITGDPVDEAFVTRIVDTVLLPILTR